MIIRISQEGNLHYRMPETDENVKLAGGKRTIFSLMDVITRI